MNKYEIDVYKLLEDSLEFEILNNRYDRFNPFKVLRIDKFEIRHSNFLSWLLDPRENHKLGSFFVKKLLAKVILKEENEEILKAYNIDLLKIKEGSFEDLEVFREVSTHSNRKIDLLCVSENMKLVLLIENKYKSGESLGQLDDYLEFIKKKYSDFTIIPIFLSLHGIEPTNNSYLIGDYSDILNILKDFIKVNEDFINREIINFINYYVDILENELIKDEEEIKMAFEIYKLNKEAIDLLVLSGKGRKGIGEKFINKDLRNYYESLREENKETYYRIYLKYKDTIDFISNIGNNTMEAAFSKFVSNLDLPTKFYISHVRVPAFILEKFLELDSILGIPKGNYWLNNVFVFFFERMGDNRLKLVLEIGPIEHEKRLLLLEELEKNNIRIKEKSKEADSLFTRISTSFKEVEDWTNINEIYEAMKNLYNEEELKNTLLVIDNIINKLTNKNIETYENDIIERDIKNKENKLKEAFLEFVNKNGIEKDCLELSERVPSFILKEFKVFDEKLGLPRWKWWLNNAFIIWFEKLKDNRLKLVIEIGPLEHSKRIILLEALESKGVKIKEKSKEIDSCYTRIFTYAKPVLNWDDKDEILKAMNYIYNSKECKEIIENICKISEGI